MPLLSDSEKSRARYHLGYLASGFAASLQYGLPRPVQTMFMVETALNQLVEDHATERLRSILCILDGIEQKLVAATTSLTVEAVGNIKFRADPMSLLEREYKRWASRLADILGVPKYAFSERTSHVGPGSNIPVSG